jgi:alpha/beta hydrolase family protein
VNPGPHADPQGARLMQDRVRAGEFEAVLDVLAARCVHAVGPRADEALAVLRAMARRAGPEVFLRQSEAVITRRDRWDVLTGLDVPTLLLWGRHDQFASVETTEAITARVRNARLVVLDDCGHLPTLERPEAWSIQFEGCPTSMTASQRDVIVAFERQCQPCEVCPVALTGISAAVAIDDCHKNTGSIPQRDSNPCSSIAARFCQRINELRRVESTTIGRGQKSWGRFVSPRSKSARL